MIILKKRERDRKAWGFWFLVNISIPHVSRRDALDPSSASRRARKLEINPSRRPKKNRWKLNDATQARPRPWQTVATEKRHIIRSLTSRARSMKKSEFQASPEVEKSPVRSSDINDTVIERPDVTRVGKQDPESNANTRGCRKPEIGTRIYSSHFHHHRWFFK